MVRPDRDRIGDRPKEHVEVDEAWIGGKTRGEGRGIHHKTLVAAAVEVRHRKPGTAQDKRKDGRYAGRVRLAIAADRSANSLCGFVENAVMPGSLIVTDDWSGYAGLRKRGYDHHAIAESGDPEIAEQFMPMIHLVFSNLKTWLNGIHHGVSAKHLQAYLNEFTFRFNFERASGLSVPTKDELGEIEATSRLKIKSDALYMTAPLIFAAENEPWLPTPVGFVLSKPLLMTVRFAELVAFDAIAKETSAAEKPDPTAVFVRLLEEQIDHLADLLELVSRDLDDASRTIFQPDHVKLSRQSVQLRRLMISTGRTSERMARIHYTLVCLDRMAKFTTDRAHDWLKPDVAARLHSICSDAASLVQFSEGLVSRAQLLQDAAVGIISSDQNDVIKVLTIASVVGIPPVLVAGTYGMNFKNIPEYDWTWGYQWSLALIVISALLPLAWFKWKDWI